MQTPDTGFTRPNPARVYNYLIGGKDNFTADRDLGEAMEAASPGLRKLAQVNRAFVLKAARWAGAMLAVAQYLDLGCGLPASPAVHDAAREGRPGAVVAYVDRDPVVLSHVSALQRGEGIAAVRADITDPAAVLGDETILGLISLHRPLCVILGGTLSAMPADVARKTVAGYTEAIAPGSCMIISCVSYADQALGDKMASMFAGAGEWTNHTREDIESFFTAGGLRVMHGTVMNVRSWPACPATGEPETPAQVLGGIGILD